MLNINLTLPLVTFDIESTGTNPQSDKIVQISATKINVNGNREYFDKLVNPGIPIPAAASAVHHIYDEDVKDLLGFESIARELFDFIGNADISGYNIIKFDIPMLVCEFERAGISFGINGRKIIDIYKIYMKLRPRDLASCYMEFTGKDIQDAHNAAGDTAATLEILEAMIDDGHVPKNLGEIEALGVDRKTMVDLDGKFVVKDGHYCFNFGKNIGKKVSDEPGYLQWMINGSFSADTKDWCETFLVSGSLYEGGGNAAGRDAPQDDDELPF